MKTLFWVQLGLVTFLSAYLLVRHRKYRKQQVIRELFDQGANDCATLSPFDLGAVQEATRNHTVDRLEAQEAYRRGYVNEEAKVALRDLASVQAQLHRETNEWTRRPAKRPA